MVVIDPRLAPDIPPHALGPLAAQCYGQIVEARTVEEVRQRAAAVQLAHPAAGRMVLAIVAQAAPVWDRALMQDLLDRFVALAMAIAANPAFPATLAPALAAYLLTQTAQVDDWPVTAWRTLVARGYVGPRDPAMEDAFRRATHDTDRMAAQMWLAHPDAPATGFAALVHTLGHDLQVLAPLLAHPQVPPALQDLYQLRRKAPAFRHGDIRRRREAPILVRRGRNPVD